MMNNIRMSKLQPKYIFTLTFVLAISLIISGLFSSPTNAVVHFVGDGGDGGGGVDVNPYSVQKTETNKYGKKVSILVTPEQCMLFHKTDTHFYGKTVTDDDSLWVAGCIDAGFCKENGSGDHYECGKAQELHQKYVDQKKRDDITRKMADGCAKFTGTLYNPNVWGYEHACVNENLCIVQQDCKLKCDRNGFKSGGYSAAGCPDKPNASSGGSTPGGPGASGGSNASGGGANTKNPNLDSHSLTGGGIGSGPVGDFLGFPAWNRGVNFNPGSKVGPELLKIVLNITEILLRLAGIAAVIVVIYAGAMFIIGSYSASPDGIAKARTILINGVIGLIIAIISTAIITFIVGSLNG